jgi:hypothetical protein
MWDSEEGDEEFLRCGQRERQRKEHGRKEGKK